FGGEALDPLDEHAPVPRAIEDREAAAAGNMAPEPPQVRLRALLFGGRSDRDVRVRARIERAGDTPDRSALAGRIVAVQHRYDRHLLQARVARQEVQASLPF